MEPLRTFWVQMKCPVHDNNLLPLKWTNAVSGKKDHDARLVFDIQGNVILVQRMYYCVRGRISHSLRSTSLDVLKSLPCSIQAYVPLELFSAKWLHQKSTAVYRDTGFTRSEFFENQ